MSCELSAISQRRMLRNPPECLRLASVTHPSCDSSKTALSELDESSLPAFDSTSAGTKALSLLENDYSACAIGGSSDATQR